MKIRELVPIVVSIVGNDTFKIYVQTEDPKVRLINVQDGQAFVSTDSYGAFLLHPGNFRAILNMKDDLIIKAIFETEQ
jgi:hypothetical protein